MKRFGFFLIFFICFYLRLLFGESLPQYIIITDDTTPITINAFQDSTPLYTTSSGNIFELVEISGSYIKILLPTNQFGWVSKKSLSLYPHTPSKERLNTAYLKSIDRSLASKKQSPYRYAGQENYYFPNAPKRANLDINVDGFYEVKVSGRDYFPKVPSDSRFERIIKDPIYNKIPKDLPENEKITFFEQENIKQSIKNLREYDFVDKLINENKLNVIGLWYQINSGLIKFLDKNNSFIDLD